MTPEQFQQHLKSLETEFKELYAKVAPRAAGVVAVRLFKENFQQEGFFVKSEKGRQQLALKRVIGGNKGEVRAANAWGRRRILTGATGDLGRSIEYKLQSNGTVLIFTDPSIFGSREPYGRVHNEGLRAGRGSGFTMPKRQFIGNHPTLRKAIAEEIERKLQEITNR